MCARLARIDIAFSTSSKRLFPAPVETHIRRGEYCNVYVIKTRCSELSQLKAIGAGDGNLRPKVFGKAKFQIL